MQEKIDLWAAITTAARDMDPADAARVLYEAADNAQRRDNARLIEALADDLRQRAADEPDADLNDAIFEAVDGTAPTIYYHHAARYLRASDNEDAWETAYGDIEALDDCQKAFFALEADLYDHLRRSENVDLYADTLGEAFNGDEEE